MSSVTHNSYCPLDSVSSLILPEMPVSSQVVSGMPVYWAAENQQFQPAYAGITRECHSGDYTLTEEADCIGLVLAKKTETRADIVLFGVVNLPDIRQFLPEGEGRFFLGIEPGTLTWQAPPVIIPMGILLGPSTPCDERVLVYVHPEYSGKPFQHTHYSVRLQESFWVSSSHFSNAPSHAVKGYKWTSDTALRDYFPPIPLEACSCTIDWNGKQSNTTILEETFGGREIPLDTCISVNSHGIWWLNSDLLPESTPESPNLTITLHFSRIQYGTDKLYVTRLQPEKGHPLEFVDCYGNHASSGDLYARFTLGNDPIEADILDGKALRKFNHDWIQENVPVIHGIRSKTTNLHVTGTPFEYQGTSFYKGLINIEATPYSEDYELQPQVVKLTEATESTYENITYIGLPYTRPAAITLKMEIPGVFAPQLRVKLRLTCLSKIDGTYPPLVLQFIRLPRPRDEVISLTGYLSPQTVAFASNVSVTNNAIFELESSEIAVSEGDTLIWILKRESSGGYISDVGLVRMTGILNRGELT